MGDFLASGHAQWDHMTGQNLPQLSIVLAVTSQDIFCFCLFLRPSYKPANDSTTVANGCLTDSQSMVFS